MGGNLGQTLHQWKIPPIPIHPSQTHTEALDIDSQEKGNKKKYNQKRRRAADEGKNKSNLSILRQPSHNRWLSTSQP